MWNIFHLIALDGSYRHETSIQNRWKELLGERAILVEDSSLICETIAGLVHMLESSRDAAAVVKDMGLTGSAATVVHNALVPVGNNLPMKQHGKGQLPTIGRKGGVTRL